MTEIYEISTFQINETNDYLINHGTSIAIEGCKLIMVKNKKIDTYEFPGGHREADESIADLVHIKMVELPRDCFHV